MIINLRKRVEEYIIYTGTKRPIAEQKIKSVNSQKIKILKIYIQCFREGLLSELEVIPEVIIGVHCIINIKYAADSVGSIDRTELQELLQCVKR